MSATSPLGPAAPGDPSPLTALAAELLALQSRLQGLAATLAAPDLATQPIARTQSTLAAFAADPTTPRLLPKLRAIERALDAAGITPLIAELKSARPPTDRWPAFVEEAVLRSHLEAAWASDPELLSFDGNRHASIVRDFAAADRERLAINARRVLAARDDRAGQALKSHHAAAQLVQREATKKARHLPFRRLMEQAAPVMSALYPCFMCSPLSVSQLLPPTPGLFDLVVFDEASQVLPEDAVPSLLRATAAVVAGDQHQLPPTPFFAAGDDDDSAEDSPAADAPADETQGFESLLANLSSFAPSHMLQWHYRSRDERLIAFSNHFIYQDRLVTFPGPAREHSVRLELVAAGGPTTTSESQSTPPNAAPTTPAPYNQTSAETTPSPDTTTPPPDTTTAPPEAPAPPTTPRTPGTNPESSSDEVRRVVDLVLAHAALQLAKPDPASRHSLGVIALGISHANRIEAAIDKALRDRRELDPFFDPQSPARFFVKNIERVQGDERDVIFLSLGVLPDAAGRVPLTRFGPINQRDTGYRRLNVAVTRARRQMVLISSFTHHQLPPTASRGVTLLRDYLAYCASHGHSFGDGKLSTTPLNPFEADIHDALTAAGIPLLPQWGVSSYKIDLVAQHKNEPGKLVLAIECDGATYHSAPTARERDRLRQQVLESLGWKFHRIWSQDWFNHREKEIAKAVAAYEATLA